MTVTITTSVPSSDAKHRNPRHSVRLSAAFEPRAELRVGFLLELADALFAHAQAREGAGMLVFLNHAST
jgi:hypothetical protein